jgi:hypothetical protein
MRCNSAQPACINTRTSGDQVGAPETIGELQHIQVRGDDSPAVSGIISRGFPSPRNFHPAISHLPQVAENYRSKRREGRGEEGRQWRQNPSNLKLAGLGLKRPIRARSLLLWLLANKPKECKRGDIKQWCGAVKRLMLSLNRFTTSSGSSTRVASPFLQGKSAVSLGPAISFQFWCVGQFARGEAGMGGIAG